MGSGVSVTADAFFNHLNFSKSSLAYLWLYPWGGFLGVKFSGLDVGVESCGTI